MDSTSPAATLLALLRQGQEAGEAPQLEAADWEAVARLALRHGVAPLLDRAFLARRAPAGLPDRLRRALQDERRATALNNLGKYGEFQRVARALGALGIPVMPLKGLHLAELVYRDVSLRPMSDLDLLVPKDDIERALAAVERLGYVKERKPASGYDVTAFNAPSGTLLELHWELAAPGEPGVPPAAELWGRATTATLFEVEVQAMPPEFLLLHVCAHLAYHHLFALDFRALCDIAELSRQAPGPDWSLVSAECRRRGGERGTAVALHLARDRLGAGVPEAALAAIAPEPPLPTMLEDALAQLARFPDYPRGLRAAPNLAGLAAPASPAARLRTLLGRVFVPRAELAQHYGVPEGSARLPLYYLARIVDLLRRYASSAGAMLGERRTLRAATERRARLERWINGR